MRHLAIDVAWVCLSVCVYVCWSRPRPAKTAEPIEMPFGLRIRGKGNFCEDLN